ncbi:hypothetical protein GEMRC1_007966 [Eukaryota sp. GEM-RC1]
MLNIGLCYGEGEGVRKNIAESLKWLKKAADLNNSDASALSCGYYAESQNFEESIIKSAKSAADMGNPLCQFAMGYLYSEGICVQKNTKMGIQYLQMAVDGGCAFAMGFVGKAHIDGSISGLEQNHIKGFELLQRSAQLNNSDAIDELIDCYGSKPFKDLKKKRYWQEEKKESGKCYPLDFLDRGGLL